MGIGPAANVALAVAGEADGTLPVTVPVLYFLEYVRQASRNYVLRQMEWHAFSLQPQLTKLRARSNSMLHTILTVGQVLGSEAFYFFMVPILCWSLADSRMESNMFVAYFTLNVYVGNWLKNCFALARAESAPMTRDTSDFGWPSMYAVNAVGLPFFLLRYLFGAVGHGTLYSLENQTLTVICYSIGILWMVVVCGARLYSGVSSPADVQGGMLVGGVLVRIWLPVCEDVSIALSSQADFFGLRYWAFLILLAAFFMLIHPFTPGDPRSWAALAYSTKAVAFATTFIIGSNACADQAWCSFDSRAEPAPSWGAWPALRLVVRSTIGFAILGASALIATKASQLMEPAVQATLPKKPCATPILRSLVTFSNAGLVVSMGVPAVITYLQL